MYATHNRPSPAWQYIEAASYADGYTFPRPCVRLSMGGAGNLYLVPIGGGAEVLFGPVIEGQVLDVQAAGIGASCDVATGITAMY